MIIERIDVPIDAMNHLLKVMGKQIKQDYVEGLTLFSQNDPELVNQYALDVKTGASGRRLVELGIEQIYAGGEPEELLQEAQKRLDNLSENGVKKSSSFHEGFLNLVQVLDNPALASESKRIPTKWKSIDKGWMGAYSWVSLM